jgi:hypothetical protein
MKILTKIVYRSGFMHKSDLLSAAQAPEGLIETDEESHCLIAIENTKVEVMRRGLRIVTGRMTHAARKRRGEETAEY